jgi:hypothetical protein
MTLLFFVQGFSQENLVTVKSSGIHENKEEAKKMALREALEMTIGVYISSSSTIENSKLLNDEVVSLSKGLIKSYRTISEFKTESNEWMVLVEAIISLNNTVNYIQVVSPKGTSVNISGGVYALNEMNKQFAKDNELTIIVETLGEMHNLFLKSFDYKLKTDEPTKSGSNTIIQNSVQVYANSNITNAANLFINVLNNTSLDLNELDSYMAQNEKYHTITFRYDDEFYFYYLRNDKSVEAIKLIFNNFSYYCTRAIINDGMNNYPLKIYTSNFLKTIPPDPSGYQRYNSFKTLYFLHQSSGLDKQYVNQIPIDNSKIIMPDSVVKYIQKILTPNEWTGSRKISKKDYQNILDLYSSIDSKNINEFQKFLNIISKNPSEFDSFVKQKLPKFGFVTDPNGSRLVLKGPKGDQLSAKYFSDDYISKNHRIVNNLFLPKENQLVGEIDKIQLKYTIEELKKLQKISIVLSNNNVYFKNGGFVFENPNTGKFIFSLHQEKNSYENLVIQKFEKNKWYLPEEKHYKVVFDYIQQEPMFNLFPNESRSFYCANLVESQFYFYLTRTLSVKYVGYDGKKEYGGPFLYGKSNSGNKKDKYTVRWIKTIK